MGKSSGCKTFEREGLERLLTILRADGYRTIGPRIRAETIIYDDITTISDLPAGYVDHQEAGSYRLEKTESPALFGVTLGPSSWKRYLFPPEVRLWQAHRSGTEISMTANENDSAPVSPPLAFIGVRPCELRAIALQDRVFLQHAYADPIYARLRANVFIVAVNCTHPGGTCFCASMETGPRANGTYDIALTEIVEGSQHYFVADIGSERGAAVLDQIPCHNTTRTELHTVTTLLHDAEQHMGRTVKTRGLKDVLYRSYEQPQWESTANQCLACGNCTMVCPTCFCTTVEDVTDLSGEHAERWRKWDSCFTLDFSYVFGGSVRNSVKSRYRQWLTHKMATWCDQFDSMGCVGCGRCITWCPVGIDITEMARAMQDAEPVPVKRKRQRSDDVSA